MNANERRSNPRLSAKIRGKKLNRASCCDEVDDQDNYRNDEHQTAMTQRLDPVWKGEAQINDTLMQDLQQAVQVVLDKPQNG